MGRYWTRYALPIDSLGFGFIVKAMEGADDVGDAPEDGEGLLGIGGSGW